jgi:hypothetical protein
LGNQTFKYVKSPEQRLWSLKQVKLLEKQKSFLEQQAYVADKKAIIFDMMIDIAEKNIKLTSEKLSTEQSTILRQRTTNNSVRLLFVRDRQTGLLSKIRRKN